jgi:hypothetical protein
MGRVVPRGAKRKYNNVSHSNNTNNSRCLTSAHGRQLRATKQRTGYYSQENHRKTLEHIQAIERKIEERRKEIDTLIEILMQRQRKKVEGWAFIQDGIEKIWKNKKGNKKENYIIKPSNFKSLRF